MSLANLSYWERVRKLRELEGEEPSSPKELVG